MLNFKKEHIIKGGDIEYLVNLSLNGYEYMSRYQRFDINIYKRPKGKRKWSSLELNRDVKSEIDHLSWNNRYDERNKLLISSVSEFIPNIEQILEELKEQLVEDVRNQILKIKFY